ncbi:MAG: T9SS type A sorting domain-containing protein [Flavobacteriia bacterium]|nr:T9SS type A sorting domain-containing protein [Flavobacteriia bacterium]
MKKLLFSALATLTTLIAFGSHLMGGTIYLTCADDPATANTYEYTITLVLIRNQSGASAPSTPTIDIWGSNTPKYQMTLNAQSTIPVPGPRPYDIHTYTGTAALPVGQHLTVEWNLCCRPAGMLNLGNGQNSASFAFRIAADISTMGSACNGTPIHIAPMSIIWPKHIPWAIAYTAYDFEGDSIHYSLDTSDPGPNATMAYVHPFSTPTGGVQIGPTSGVFTYEADSVGSFNTVIRMDAYDSAGVWTSTNRAEMHIEVINTSSGSNSLTFTPPSSVVNNRYQFRVGVPDTLELSAQTAGTNIDATYFVPPNVDLNNIYFNTEIYKQAATVDVDFSWTPQAGQEGEEFPVVIRFQGDDWTYDYVFTVEGGANNIGLAEADRPSVTIYPNPSSGQITVDFDRSMSKVQVLNMTGQVVLTREVSSSARTVRLSEFPNAGPYFIRLFDKNGDASSYVVIVE